MHGIRAEDHMHLHGTVIRFIRLIALNRKGVGKNG